MSDREQQGRWLYAGALALAAFGLLGFLAYKGPSKKAPANSLVFGCYRAEKAPAVVLDKGGLAIAQSGMRPVPYRLDRAKNGIFLHIDMPLDLEPGSTRYRFANHPGTPGRDYPFVRRTGDRAYYTFDRRHLDVFHVTASDGLTVEYRRQSARMCGATPLA